VKQEKLEIAHLFESFNLWAIIGIQIFFYQDRG